MFISLYTTRLILNALGVSDYGIYIIVGGSIELLGFLNSAMAASSQRFMSYAQGEKDQEKQIRIFNISFLLHLGISIFALLAFSLAGYFFFHGILEIPEGRESAAIIIYCSMAVSTAFTMMSVPYEAVMNAHENMKYYSIVGIFESLLKLAIAFAVAYATFDKLIVYGILMAFIPFVTLTIMRFYCHRHYEECKVSPKQYFDKALMLEMTSFAGWGFISSTAALFTMQGMAILLNMFGGVVVNAAHGVANQLAGQLMVFSNNMLKAMNPVLVKSRGAGATNKMLEGASTGNKLSFIVYTLFAIPFVVECPFILKIWLKDVPEYAVLFVRLVLIRQMISQMFVTLDTCISAVGRIRSYSLMSSLIWISPILLAYVCYIFGAPIYTIYLLLILMVVGRSINSLYFCRKLCGLDCHVFFRYTIFPCVMICTLTFAILLVLQDLISEGYFRLIAIFFVAFLFCPIFSYYIGLNKNEKTMLLIVVQSFKSRLRK